MAGPDARRIVEVVGLVGVIGSLWFVGLTRAATDAEIASQFLDLNTAMFEGRDLARAFEAAAEAGDPSQAPYVDQFLLRALYRGLFHIWSNTHRQHLNGTVNPLLFQAVTQEIVQYASPADSDTVERLNISRRNLAWAWESERFIYNPEFQEFVDSIIEAVR
jgi:hypothetical protein